MTDSQTQARSVPVGAHLVLYDGVCGLCSLLLQFLLRHDRRHVFSFASLQSPIGQSMVQRNGGTPGELTSFYVIANYQTASPRVFTRSDAALVVAGALDWPWKAARVMRFLPLGIRDGVYDVVARSRYRLFARYERCLVPRPEFRHRFID